MPYAALEVSLHRTIRAGPMRPHRTMALRASQLSFSVAGQRLIYGNRMPSLVGPELAVFKHGAKMDRAGVVTQANQPMFRFSGYIRKSALS